MTIYWLGRAASNMPSYAGPELNMEAFSGLVGTKVCLQKLVCGN